MQMQQSDIQHSAPESISSCSTNEKISSKPLQKSPKENSRKHSAWKIQLSLKLRCTIIPVQVSQGDISLSRFLGTTAKKTNKNSLFAARHQEKSNIPIPKHLGKKTQKNQKTKKENQTNQQKSKE